MDQIAVPRPRFRNHLTAGQKKVNRINKAGKFKLIPNRPVFEKFLTKGSSTYIGIILLKT